MCRPNSTNIGRVSTRVNGHKFGIHLMLCSWTWLSYVDQVFN